MQDNFDISFTTGYEDYDNMYQPVSEEPSSQTKREVIRNKVRNTPLEKLNRKVIQEYKKKIDKTLKNLQSIAKYPEAVKYQKPYEFLAYHYLPSFNGMYTTKKNDPIRHKLITQFHLLHKKESFVTFDEKSNQAVKEVLQRCPIIIYHKGTKELEVNWDNEVRQNLTFNQMYDRNNPFILQKRGDFKIWQNDNACITVDRAEEPGGQGIQTEYQLLQTYKGCYEDIYCKAESTMFFAIAIIMFQEYLIEQAIQLNRQMVYNIQKLKPDLLEMKQIQENIMFEDNIKAYGQLNKKWNIWAFRQMEQMMRCREFEQWEKERWSLDDTLQSIWDTGAVNYFIFDQYFTDSMKQNVKNCQEFVRNIKQYEQAMGWQPKDMWKIIRAHMAYFINCDSWEFKEMN